ncbi:DUF11 domain-containing protein [Fibrella sp. HMF5335]|uniref:DUF11 domain-containing protein n=1 Tax=Fibrella rubiginis TaxID=2817060 RepID=A0A939JZP8_9BACT|nr:SdrD B-like domain-containing protein [Fibrella rubiginis]MBO0935272.1 DUF11 domain-containing protein [Fibrella rubiginis]
MHISTFKTLRAVVWLLVSLAFCALPGYAQTISGTVYRDFNGDGTFAAATAEVKEVGVQGIVVTAYSSNSSTAPISATTSSTGGYTLTTGGGLFRLEFTNVPTGFYETMTGVDNGTGIRFAAGGDVVNLGVNRPAEYCPPNPPVAIPCFLIGKGAVDENVVVTVPYEASGIDAGSKQMLNTPSPASSASATVGSVWGTAYRRSTDDLFTGAFMKRHSAFGSGGLGAIYRTSSASTPSASATSLFVTLNAGTDPHNTADYFKDEIQSGKNPFDAVGKVGLGDIDISADGKYLYAINLFDKKLYRIAVDADNNAATNPAPADITSYAFPATSCPSGVGRPFGMGINPITGNIYASITCDGSANSSTSTASGLSASIYEFNVTTLSFNSAPVSAFSLNYTRGVINDGRQVFGTKSWHNWISTWEKNVSPNISDINQDYGFYPQPLLSDIVFDDDGSLVIGITDRFSHQFVPGSYDAVGTNQYGGTMIAGGDIVRACNTGTLANPIYVLDPYNGGLCGTNGNGTTGKNNNDNTLSIAEFYSDEYIDPYHYETALGGLALVHGSGQVVTSVMDPVNVINTNGFSVFSNTTGDEVRDFQIVPSGELFSKGSSVGDIEIMCKAAPIEIGNRVWNDTNNNGVQDAGEPPMAGVTVTLKGPGSTTIATAITNSAGEYYFSNAAGTPTTGFVYSLTGLTYGGSYSLCFPTSFNTLSLSAKANAATGANADAIDTDPNAAGIISFTLGQAGQNNFTYDAAFVTTPFITTSTLCAKATLIVGDLLPNGGGQTMTFPFSTSANSTNPAPGAGNLNTGGEALAVSPDNKYVYIGQPGASNGASQVNIYDAVTKTFVSSFTTTASLYDLAVSNNGNKLYVTTARGLESFDVTNKANPVASAVLLTAAFPASSGGQQQLWGVAVEPVTGNVFVSRGFGFSGGDKGGIIAKVDANLSTTPTLVANDLKRTLMGIKFLPDGSFLTAGKNNFNSTDNSTPDAILHYKADGTYLDKRDVVISNWQNYTASGATSSTSNSTQVNKIACGPDGNIYVTTFDVYCVLRYIVNPSASTGPVNTWEVYLPKPAVGSGKALAFLCDNDVTFQPCQLSVATPTTACVLANNTYSITGTISVSSASPNSLTVRDGAVSTVVSLSGGQTTATYSLTGLTPGSGSHTVVVTSQGLACGSATVGYSAPTSCSVVPMPTYALAKTVDLKQVEKGQIVTYTISLTNTSGTTATSLVLTDGLSSSAVTLVGSATASTGTFAPGLSGGTWTIPSLSGGQVATLTLKVQLNEEGIIYNTITLPGQQTATTCVSVPAHVCAGEVFQFDLTAPASYSTYQWSRNGQPIVGATTSTLSVTAVGEYTVAATSLGGCPDGSCCPFIVVADPAPSLTALAVSAQCIGQLPQANGAITLVGSSSASLSYNITKASSFTAAAPLLATPQPLSAVVGGLLLGGQPNPATPQDYTIRVYSATGCFSDTVVRLLPTTCVCPPTTCAPFVVKKTKSQGKAVAP